MRQVLAVLVLAALLLGATVEASTSSFGVRISMVEAVYDPYPVSPPSSFTAAVLELEAKEDIYVRSNMCPHFENLICSGSNIFPCCKDPVNDCDPITLKSKNSSACACASRKDRVCVDDQTPFTNVNDGGRFLTATPWERPITFEIPLKNACWPMIISTGSLFGDYDVYLVWMTESPDADLLGPVLGAFTFGQDSLMLCPGNLSAEPGTFGGPNNMSMWLDNKPPGDDIPRIMGFMGGYGHFNLTVKEVTHRQGLVRYAEDLNYKLALPTINCTFQSNSTIKVVPSGPPVVPTMLPAVDEPALDLLLASASVKNLYEDILNSYATKRNTRTMAMLISVAQDTLNSVTSSTPFFGCQLNASMLVDASGMPFEDLVILQQTDPDLTTCDFERLQRLQKVLDFSEENCSSTSADVYCKLLANTTNLALSGITRVMLAPGVQSTVTWANCQKFVQKFLWSSANYSAPDNTDCWATPGTEEYADDPCCNVKLLWEHCCNPRSAPPITWTPNDTLISDECGESECAYNLASALSTYQSTQYQCRKEGIDAAMTVYDPFSNGLNVRGLGPCASAVAGNNDTEFLECANTYLDTAYKAEFYSLWGETNESIADWLEIASRTYTMLVCHQPGLPPFNPSEPPTRNLSLDNNLTACAAFNSCNWGDPGQTNDSCERSFRGQFMCASCTDGYCIDQTTPQVCYVPWLSEVQCRELNGTVSDPPIMCWLNGTTEQADCLPAQYCEPDSLICPSLCYFPSLNQSDCAAAGPGRVWNTNNSLCVLESSTQVLREDCDLFGGAFWHGAQWQAGVRNTSSTCLGYCDDFPSATTEAECNSYPRPTGKCSNYGFYDEASCNSTEGCNDTVLYNHNKPACITDFLVYTSTATGCGGVGTSVPGAGCIYDDDSVPPLTAAGICSDPEFPGVLRGPATNQKECEELSRCQEANFAPNVTTPKNNITCKNCSGTPVQAFKWGTGKWTPFSPVSHWHPLTWVARNYSNRYYSTISFNREAFLLDFYQVLAARQARAVKAAYLCKGGGLFDLVSAMACRCGASAATVDDSKCKPIGAYFVLERTRACLASPLPIDFGLPGESVQLMPGASYSPACADLSIEEVNIELFQRRSLVESSSILLQILAPNENAVVPNSVGVIVAVLAGDGRRIALEKTVLASSPGNYTVCIAYNHSREVANFKHPGMAMWDARSRKWTLVTDGVRVISTQILCANLTISPDMIVFPVKAVKHPESQPFKDYLSPPVRRAILASIIVYIVLSLLTLLRLLLAIGATIEDPKDSKLSNLLVCIMFLAIFAATTLRWVYSLVFYLGRNIHASDGVQLLLVDLPFFLYATAFSILISRWARMYYEYLQYMRTTENLNINTKRVSFVAVSVNVVLYVLFIAVLFTFSTKSLPNNNGESACTATSDKSSARILHIVGKAYRSIEALVSVLLAVGFLVYSCVVYMPYWHIFVPSSNFQMLLNVSIIALLCAICLLLQAATFLYAAYTSTVDGTFIIITLLVVESIPVITLLFMRSARAMLPCLPWCTMPEPTSTTKSSDVNQAESD